jgi:predicted ATPase/transcriptional regulator with XRE-family HTH domain
MIVEFMKVEVAMLPKTSFGQWLKQRRKALDLTREDLAGYIGCAAVTINKIEADKRRPSKQIAALLAEHLNIPADEIPAFIQFARAEASESTAPWGTPFHPPTNLPAQPTLLIGRDEDVAAICKRLLQPESRLLTLIGPPGIGKTRLALQVGTQALDDFADGVFFVALAPISDANLVCTTIASTLGVADVGPQTPLERLKAYLRDKQLLLVLDNFEQILGAAAQIAELLTACLWLKILATSRSPLRIRQERQMPVSPLLIPDLAYLPDVETVTGYSAVTLFLERAQAVKPDFSLSPENAPTVAAICIRLDGLPLAIELISARVKLLSPVALLERLHGRLMLQSDGLRDFESRHRTLNAAIDWSYQLLSMDEQMLFRRLGIFVGGWTLDAAESICAETLNLNMLDGMTSLLDKNLVKQGTNSDGEPRFMMLETIREYALEQLAVSRELDDLRQRHVDYFVTLAEGAEAHAFGREQIVWFDQLEVELDNLRTVLTWSLDSETGLRLAAALGWFFTERTHWNEGLGWLERMVAANPDAPPSLRSKALHTAGALAWLAVNSQRARVLLEQALALARAANDRWNIAWSLGHRGNFVAENTEQAAAALDESLALFRELDDAMGITHILLRRAWVAQVQKDYPYMAALLDEAENRARQAGDKVIIAWISSTKGLLALEQDRNLIHAKTHLESSLLLFREARMLMGVKNALSCLGSLELELGNVMQAQARTQEFLSLREIEPGDPYLPDTLVTLVRITRGRGQFERAARLLGATNSIMLAFKRHDTSDIRNFDSEVAALRGQLGEAAFAEAWAAGKAMTPEQMIAYALDQKIKSGRSH